jgi:hypothetical protein
MIELNLEKEKDFLQGISVKVLAPVFHFSYHLRIVRWYILVYFLLIQNPAS